MKLSIFLIGLVIMMLAACDSPEPTPTADPTATPTPTPTTGTWEYWEDTDSFTDEAMVGVSIVAIDTDVEWPLDSPWLHFRCVDAEFDAFVWWGGKYVSRHDPFDAPLHIRWDDADVLEWAARYGGDNEFTFMGRNSRDALLFADKARESSLLRIRYVSNREPITAIFNVEGADVVLAQLPCKTTV